MNFYLTAILLAAIEAELGAVAVHVQVKVGFPECSHMEVKVHCKML